MADSTYRIKVVRGDLEFEAEGDKAFVLQMVERFEAAQPRGKGPRSGEHVGAKGGRPEHPPTTGKSIAVGEFIRRLGVKRHTHLVLAFGYYLEHYAGIPQFGPADINNCYYDAKLDPSNTSLAISRNIRSTRMMEARADDKGKKGRKKYTLTRTGEEYILDLLKAKPE